MRKLTIGRRHRGTAPALATLALASILLPLVAGSHVTFVGGVLGAFAVFLTLLPATLYFFGPQPTRLPFLAGIGAFYAVFFALAPFTACLIWPGDGRSLSAVQLASILSRVNQGLTLGVVLEATPERVPFWRGETLAPLITSLVPRIIWPDKPQERAANAFGKRYAFIPPEEVSMSANLPWLIEGYANFGWMGLAALMALGGAVLGVFDRVCNHSGGVAERAVGAAVLFPLMNQESNFSLTIGSTPIILLVLFCGFRLAALADRKFGRITR